MFLHRFVNAATFVADPAWSTTQVIPPALTLPERQIAGGGAGGAIYWWAVLYDGNDPDTSQPIDATGITFDARFVYVMTPSLETGRPNRLVLGRTSPGEVAGGPIPVGREVVEDSLPRGAAGSLQMISLAGAPPPGSYLWLWWAFESKGRL